MKNEESSYIYHTFENCSRSQRIGENEINVSLVKGGTGGITFNKQMSNRLISEGFKKALLREDTITGELCIIINKGDKGLNIVTSGGHGSYNAKINSVPLSRFILDFFKIDTTQPKSHKKFKIGSDMSKNKDCICVRIYE